MKHLGKIKKIFKDGKKVRSEAEAQLICLEYKDGDLFIAHCLEFDLVSQGATLEEARKNLADLIFSHVQFAAEKDIEDKSLFHPAPSKYWEIYFHWKSRMARQSLLKGADMSPQNILSRMACAYAHI